MKFNTNFFLYRYGSPSFLQGCCFPVNRRLTTLRYACTTVIIQICKAPKPFVLVLLQTRSPSKVCKATLVYPVSTESHSARIHCHFSSYAKPKASFSSSLLRQNHSTPRYLVVGGPSYRKVHAGEVCPSLSVSEYRRV
jgi:hypothetical protein